MGLWDWPSLGCFPMTSFSRSEVNLTMSIQILLSSVTFMTQRFTLREWFSRSFKRSNSTSLVAFNAAMSASALLKPQSFSQPLFLQMWNFFQTHSHSWNYSVESWIGAREDLIITLMSSLSCFSSSEVNILEASSLWSIHRHFIASCLSKFNFGSWSVFILNLGILPPHLYYTPLMYP